MKNKARTLAVVIPYYKRQYFADLLVALSKQTITSFKVYVGDDCSPEDPRDIITSAPTNLTIKYHRFESRLGGISLTSHWNRCLLLTQNEEWVWVIPDDDMPAPNCVEEFMQALSKTHTERVNVFTIPVQKIDENGEVTEDARPNEMIKDNYSFYLDQLKCKTTGSSLGENIFRFKALLGQGGFVDFPKAWGSDHATILAVSAGSSIYCLQKARFGFRQSRINISSQTYDGAEKMYARTLFARWLKSNESIFPVKPDKNFYKHIYWRGEYYALNHWTINPKLIWQLIRLRFICTGSWNLFSLAWLFFNHRKKI